MVWWTPNRIALTSILNDRGNCIEQPIYLLKQQYNFQICLFNHIYREKIVFKNRGTKAMKIQIQQPKYTKKYFEFNPMIG